MLRQSATQHNIICESQPTLQSVYMDAAKELDIYLQSPGLLRLGSVRHHRRYRTYSN